jgi:MYXO-CTERM domain-containing protein
MTATLPGTAGELQTAPVQITLQCAGDPPGEPLKDDTVDIVNGCSLVRPAPVDSSRIALAISAVGALAIAARRRRR